MVKLLTQINLEIESLCSADRGGRSLVPLSKRKMAAFYKRLQRNDCYDFFERNADGFYQVELISSLILQGEMNTVLRIISSPFVDFANWRRNRPCNCAVSAKCLAHQGNICSLLILAW